MRDIWEIFHGKLSMVGVVLNIVKKEGRNNIDSKIWRTHWKNFVKQSIIPTKHKFILYNIQKVIVYFCFRTTLGIITMLQTLNSGLNIVNMKFFEKLSTCHINCCIHNFVEYRPIPWFLDMTLFFLRNTELGVMNNKVAKRSLIIKMSGHSNFSNVYQIPGMTGSLSDCPKVLLFACISMSVLNFYNLNID